MKELTKQHILKTFNELITVQPFEKITVAMLIEKSNVSKSTFYRYFLDKYDVMNYNYKVAVDSLFDFNICDNWEEVFQRLFYMTYKGKRRIKNSFLYSGENSYDDYLYQYSFHRVKERVEAARGGKRLTEEENFQLSHFCYGTIWTTFEWVNDKWDLSHREVAKLIYSRMPASMNQCWTKAEKIEGKR